MSYFSKEERIAWEQMLEGFESALTMSNNVNIYSTNQTEMARSGDTIWRPMPMIIESYDGSDQSANFNAKTQLTVPVTIDRRRSVPFVLTSQELRDMAKVNELTQASKDRLANDIDIAITDAVSDLGSLVVTVTTAAGTFADFARCDTIMTQQGVPQRNRYMGLSADTYNGAAANLSAVTRSFGNQKSERAYTDGYLGRVAKFETYSLDANNRFAAAAAGGATLINTTVAGANFYTPVATSTATTGQWSNVDPRFQTITVDNTGGILAGDCFTISGVEAVHHTRKTGTGRAKTFRVVSVTDGTHLVITPPIISAQGGTVSELQYQNCIVTPAAAAPFTWLNTAAADINPFWTRDSLEIIPGRLITPGDAGAGVLYGTVGKGFQVKMTKQYDILTDKTLYRTDVFFGVANLNPEMNGIIIFNQP